METFPLNKTVRSHMCGTNIGFLNGRSRPPNLSWPDSFFPAKPPPFVERGSSRRRRRKKREKRRRRRKRRRRGRGGGGEYVSRTKRMRWRGNRRKVKRKMSRLGRRRVSDIMKRRCVYLVYHIYSGKC